MRFLIALAASSLICVVSVSQTAAQAPRAMSFQGYLTNTLGTPIDGLQTLTLKLFDAGTVGTMSWSRTYAGVVVNDGVFDVVLENGTPSFEDVSFDDSLWIQVQVGAEVISPRRPLTASPYAMGLSLPIDATVEAIGNGDAALSVVNSATDGINYGIVGRTNSTNGTGVRGLADATSAAGAATGVYGQSDTGRGIGVFGKATATSGSNAGVFGDNYSNQGRGVFGRANTNTGITYGVYGESGSQSGRGVFGDATRASGTSYGVYGLSSSSAGTGVYGSADSFTGTTYGVYGRTSSGAGWSGYFSGGQGTYTISADNNNPDLILGGSSNSTDDGIIGTDPAYESSDLWFYTNDNVIVRLNYDGSFEDSDFEIRNSSNVNIFNVDDSGSVTSAGTASHGSDRNRKDGIVDVNPREILDDVVRLPISRWRYKGESVPHVGPMAQDFYSSFGVGADNRHIATVDADGVALAAIQGLYALVKDLQAENEQMRGVMERAGLE